MVRAEGAGRTWLWPAVVSTIVLLIGSVPTIAGWASANQVVRFRGTFFDRQDYAVHISAMRAGAMGDLGYTMRFTSEPHAAIYTKLFYVVLGRLSGSLGLVPEVGYQLARLAFGYAALFAIYAAAVRLFRDMFYARLGFLLAILGSGLGWLQLMLGAPLAPISPVDFWLIDMYVFFSLALFPHFAFLLAAGVGAILLYIEWLSRPSATTLAAVCGLALSTQIVSPTTFLTIDVALAGATLRHVTERPREWRWPVLGLLAVLLVQIPLVAYAYAQFARDPIWSQFSVQNVTLSPPPTFIAFGLGLLLPGALLGLTRVRYTRGSLWFAMAGWGLSALLLAYAPVGFQRRFLMGVSIPIGLLAALGLEHAVRSVASAGRTPAWPAMAAITVALLATVSSIYLALGSAVYMSTRPPEYFYPRSIDAALAWLRRNAEADEFALSTTETSQLIAQRTDLRVYIGHPMETIAFDEKTARVASFFAGTTPPDWILATPIRWVIIGPRERAAGQGLSLPPWMQLIYSEQRTDIYVIERR